MKTGFCISFTHLKIHLVLDVFGLMFCLSDSLIIELLQATNNLFLVLLSGNGPTAV